MKSFYKLLVIFLCAVFYVSKAFAIFPVQSVPTMLAWPNPQPMQYWYITADGSYWQYNGAEAMFEQIAAGSFVVTMGGQPITVINPQNTPLFVYFGTPTFTPTPGGPTPTPCIISISNFPTQVPTQSVNAYIQGGVTVILPTPVTTLGVNAYIQGSINVNTIPPTISFTPTDSFTSTVTTTFTSTSTVTLTPTITNTPTVTLTPSITNTPWVNINGNTINVGNITPQVVPTNYIVYPLVVAPTRVYTPGQLIPLQGDSDGTLLVQPVDAGAFAGLAQAYPTYTNTPVNSYTPTVTATPTKTFTSTNTPTITSTPTYANYTDPYGRTYSVSTGPLGESISCWPRNQLEVDFSKGINSALITTTVSGSGTTALSSGAVSLSVSAGGTGEAKLQSAVSLIYRAGHDFYFRFTGGFFAGTATDFEREGAYNGTDGFWIGYEGVTFGISYVDAGVTTFIPQSAWNGDLCQGQTASKFTSLGAPVSWNQNLLVPIEIIGSWFGAAPVRFDVLSPDSTWVTIHTFKFPNSQNVPYTATNTFYLTADVMKNSPGSASKGLNISCWSIGTLDPLSSFSDPITKNTLALLTESGLVGFDSNGNGQLIGVTSANGAYALNAILVPTNTPTITATPVNSFTPTLTPTVTSTPYTNVSCNSGTATGFSSSSAVSQSILPTRVANYTITSFQGWSLSGATTVTFTHDQGTPVPGYTNIPIYGPGMSFGWPPNCSPAATGINNLSITQSGPATLQGVVYAY